MLYGYTRTNPFRIVGKIIMFWKNLIPNKIKRFSLLLESKLIYLRNQFRNHICTLISGTRNFDLFHRKYCSYVRYLLQSEYHLTFSQNFSFSYKYPYFERLSTGQKDIFSFLEWNTQHIYEIQLIRLIESNLCSLFTFGSIYGLKKKWAYKYAGIEGSKFASL